MDDVHLTEREQRLLRREQLKADIAQKEREIQERTNENRLKKIKQRDRNIEMLQLQELQRQRNKLIEKRRHAIQERDEQHRVVEEQRIELRDKPLRTQSRTSDIESQRLKETVIDIEYEDDELKGACGHTNIDSDIKRLEFGENSRYTERTYTDQSLITINEYGYVDRERTMPKDQNHCKYFDQFSTVSNDTVDKGIQWLRRKEIQLEEEHHANSEDRIKIEGEIDRTQCYQLIHKCNKREIDFEMEMETLQKQIELMKLEEREAVRKIQIKEELRETKRKEKLQAEQRKQNEDRLRTLKQEKYELEQSLLEMQRVLSSLAEELLDYGEERNKPQVRKISESKQAFIIKPNIPTFTEPSNFPEWKIEIQSMLSSNIYHREILRQAIRNAIGGKPRKILATLKPTATSEEILEALESNYGDIKSGECIMEEYYKAKQEKEEDISARGIRLEELVQKAIDRGEIQTHRREQMLRTRFWKYLRNKELKNATRIFYESNIPFEELRKKMRREEQDISVSKETSQQINVHQIEDHTKMTLKSR
ncbi:trichohyalin-like [Dreissena polymorpha]|uniref:Paraneoplastic antigen Ma-like C-terminal domain-containing protein n=1 Tax=Dreissena polymorpha TaxID=45954 RepID=A0A9D4L4I5_DREPO|nr:trichohyalin-like [Dreissena polymorpha]XP_052271637.1 trichohyalin-like [Dreissena polymorpha]KAH3851811.1 hypothetical protein DPMN_094297 [Dreissena polymorpha]KAH3851812.1 hypothetical protein DPMN_094298 [Dreissena polymorpha]